MKISPLYASALQVHDNIPRLEAGKSNNNNRWVCFLWMCHGWEPALTIKNQVGGGLASKGPATGKFIVWQCVWLAAPSTQNCIHPYTYLCAPRGERLNSLSWCVMSLFAVRWNTRNNNIPGFSHMLRCALAGIVLAPLSELAGGGFVWRLQRTAPAEVVGTQGGPPQV